MFYHLLRSFGLIFILGSFVCAADDASTGASPLRVTLLPDVSFSNGLTIWSPDPGKKVECGTIRIHESDSPPSWGIAQWHSRFNLAGVAHSNATQGEFPTWFDGAKRVTLVMDDEQVKGLRFALDGIGEYEGRYRQPGDAWPHLLAECRFAAHPRLDRLESVPFHVRFQLHKAERLQKNAERWDDKIHTGQFQCFLTVQNLNRQSEGFGDYLWFGIPLYDARQTIPRPHMAQDKSSEKKSGTGKFIYNPGGAAYTDRSAHDGQPIEIDADLLPMIRKALQTAWQRGYLRDSHDMADYALGGMNIGWEVTGPIAVEAEFTDLSIGAELKPE